MRFDTRGHGGSTATEGPYSLDLLAADAAALLEFLGIDAFHYIGLSMGGMVGQMLALRHPSQMKSPVLCDTSSAFELDIRERVRIVETMGMEPMVEPTLQRFLSAEFRRCEPETAEKVASMIRTTPPTGYIGCGHAISKLELAPQIRDVRCPVLVVVGEHDAVTPIAMARAINDSIPGSGLVVIPDASHLADVEQPSRFTEEVMRLRAAQHVPVPEGVADPGRNASGDSDPAEPPFSRADLPRRRVGSVRIPVARCGG